MSFSSFAGGVLFGAAASGFLFYTYFEDLADAGRGDSEMSDGSDGARKHASGRSPARGTADGGSSLTAKDAGQASTNVMSKAQTPAAAIPNGTCTRTNPVPLCYTSIGVIESCFPSCRGTRGKVLILRRRPRSGFIMTSLRTQLMGLQPTRMYGSYSTSTATE